MDRIDTIVKGRLQKYGPGFKAWTCGLTVGIVGEVDAEVLREEIEAAIIAAVGSKYNVEMISAGVPK